MKYIIHIYDGNEGEQYAFGPYDKEDGQRIMGIYGSEHDDYIIDMLPLITLSEALDNPIGYLEMGDSPDE